MTFKESYAKIQRFISAWFRLVQNIRAKYSVLDCDFNNFDETGFMIGIICPSMIVTRADRRGRGKAVQPGNREWATAIACINSEGWSAPPFLVVQGKNHLAKLVGILRAAHHTIRLLNLRLMAGRTTRRV
jgi:hypothetical protein